VAADPAVDRLVAGRYECGERIGRGGMGEVHAAWDRRLERRVAIKTLRADVAAQPSARRRFETEARSAARLVHPNVVAVYDSGEDGGIPYMVMERLPGRSLRDEIADGPMPVRAVQSLASQVLGALGAAHAAGIVHRDIKPANILKTEDGRWKVSDFGIAKSLQMQGADDTVTGMVLGTPAYLAPERLFGGEATPAGDLYSLGVILYEALAGRRPFHADSPEGWAAVISAQAPEPLVDMRRDVPPAMVLTIERSISRDPAARFSSAEEMAEALGVRQGWNGAAGVIGAAGVGGAAEPGSAGGAGPASWREVAPASPEDTELLGTVGAGATEVLHAGAARRRLGLAVLAGGAAVAAIVGISVAAGTSGSGSPASKTHLPPTTPATVATTLPTTTLPPATAPPPGPPKHDHGGGGGGPGKGGDGGGG